MSFSMLLFEQKSDSMALMPAPLTIVLVSGGLACLKCESLLLLEEDSVCSNQPLALANLQ